MLKLIFIKGRITNKMNVTNTTQTTYVTQVQTTKNITKTDSSSFDVEGLNDKTPRELTFDQYKQLTDGDIEKLFGKNNDNEIEASKLQDAAQFTDDDTLNKVFEKTLADIETDGEFSMFSSLAFLYANPIDLQAEINHTFDPDNIEHLALTPEQRQSPFFQELLSKKDGYIHPKPQYKDRIDIHDSKELIDYFINFKEHFDENIDKPNVTFYFDRSKLFETVNDILKDYDKKVKENEALLASYTRNNKPQALEENKTNDH